MKCYVCGENEFVPDPAQVADQGNSGRDFEPTDWECDDYQPRFPVAAFDAMEAGVRRKEPGTTMKLSASPNRGRGDHTGRRRSRSTYLRERKKVTIDLSQVRDKTWNKLVKVQQKYPNCTKIELPADTNVDTLICFWMKE